MKIPKTETDEIEAALTKMFGANIAGETFSVSGMFEPGFLHIDLQLKRRDDTFRYSMQFRCALVENRLDQAAALTTTVDFAGWYLEQYFGSGRDLLLPLDFQPYNFGEHIVYACGDIDNPKLTKMADEILNRGQVCD